MADIKSESLTKALGAACCRDLPTQYRECEGKGFWMKAIVLVRKANMSECYMLAGRKGDGRLVFERDFGLVSPIVATLGIYPYKYFDEGGYGLLDCSRERKVAYLVAHFGEAWRSRIEKADDETLEAYVRERGMALQESNDSYADKIDDLVYGDMDDNTPVEIDETPEKDVDDSGDDDSGSDDLLSFVPVSEIGMVKKASPDKKRRGRPRKS